MCESFSDNESVLTEKSGFRPTLKYLLTGWRMRASLSTFPFNHSQDRKLCRMVFAEWKAKNYLTTEQFQIAAYSFAIANDIKVLRVWEKCGRASNHWLKNFLTRHPEVRDMLIGKRGAPPKRKSDGCEEDLLDESPSEYSDDDDDDDDDDNDDSLDEDEDSDSELDGSDA
ncbi:protein SIS2 [Galendromus occidentalis]|uniref:Protein SIS2 n=1 Tax=Galendromus occidentalis TaxID=34638 RepID=A0AAJ6VZ94_9ACAR|nr:protein SIS2 [Galendromus occidentalis]